MMFGHGWQSGDSVQQVINISKLGSHMKKGQQILLDFSKVLVQKL